MNKFKKIFAIAVSFSLVTANISLAQTANTYYQDPVSLPAGNVTNVMHADIKSERVPSGTQLKLRMDTPVNTLNHSAGDIFRANLVEDVRIGRKTILPAGTLVRGRVETSVKGRCFTRGGKLALTFNDIVTPMGKQVPLNVRILSAKQLTPDGTFATGESYFKSVGKGIDKGSSFLLASTEYGMEKGKSVLKGYPVFLTVPLGAAVGLAGAGAIISFKTVYAMFDKGENIKIQPGDTLDVTLLDPLDVPLY